MQLREYQEDLNNEVIWEISKGVNYIMVQLPTGGGKTVCFGDMTYRFISKLAKRVLICVHRKELMNQCGKTFSEWYGINVQCITAETTQIYDRPCYIAMVETINRRLAKNPYFLPPIGMVILDERHMGNFNKIHKYFGNSINIGFSATPLSANKKEPLNKYYEKIVCGPQIQELIKLGALVQNHTYSIEGVKREKLKIVNGRFDEKFMGDEYSKLRNVKNTIINYEAICPNTKAICYNCNIEHSRVMHQAWVEAGYQSRWVDDTTSDEDRKNIFRWFEETPKSILNNVGIAAMGYDNPSIQTVIANRATTSPTLPIQWGGRGSRPFEDKEFFTILDMGGNYKVHGDWNSDRDWEDVFYNPPKKNNIKLGAQPVKDCPNCKALIPMQARICHICGFEIHVAPIKYDAKPIALELITKYISSIDEEKLIKQNEHRKTFYSLCQIGWKIGAYVKHRSGGYISDEVASKTLEEVRKKAENWCKIKNIPYDKTVKWLSKKTLFEAMGYESLKDSKKSKIEAK